jgi:capsular polysaccharide biosynthesis protein
MSEQQRHDGEDYWAAIYRRRWIIFLVTILSAVFSAYFSSIITPLYQASAQFYVPQDAINSPGGGLKQSLIRIPVVRDQARMYVAVLESRDASVAVADQLEDRSFQDISRAADFDVSPSAALVVYARDRDPAVAQRMVELFLEYFRDYHSLRLDDTLMVLEKPFVSQNPVFPVVVLNTLIGFAGGILLGIIYGLFLDYLDVRALARKIGQIERENWLETVFNEELGRRDQNAT